MYYKEINGRTVFSECKSILMPDGTWVSNPTDEQIAEAGFSVYIPPVVPPTPHTEPGYDQIVEAVKKMLSSQTAELSDEDALNVVAVFPTWFSKTGTEVAAGERLWYDEYLWKVLQSHTVQDNWTPPTSPSLYVKVSIAEIPDWVQPTGAQDAYNKGDKVKHNDKTWESDVDYNTWEPGVYGWSEL